MGGAAGGAAGEAPTRTMVTVVSGAKGSLQAEGNAERVASKVKCALDMMMCTICGEVPLVRGKSAYNVYKVRGGAACRFIIYIMLCWGGVYMFQI